MTAATNANPNLVETAIYDPAGHQSVAMQAGAVSTDNSVTPPVLYAPAGMAFAPNSDNIIVLSSQSFPVGTTNSTDQTNTGGKGAVIFVNISAIGTGTLQLAIQGKDPVTGLYYVILQDAFAITTNNGTYAFEVYPGVTPITSTSGTVPGPGVIRTAVSQPVPKTWRAQVVVATAAVTAQVDVSYVG